MSRAAKLDTLIDEPTVEGTSSTAMQGEHHRLGKRNGDV